MNTPLFVVVGHVNRGKSSIVSTLAADDTIRIDVAPGTTRNCQRYPLTLAGEILYTLIDTPGFERPRQLLAWLRERETTTAERPQAVAAFVEAHRVGDAFREECALLEPILCGGDILYVVDSSRPPSAKEEAEMEILRWTGRPRVALINSIGTDDYLQTWRPLLDQYFNLVRTFNAHKAGFAERMRLLGVLREMSESHQEAIDRAIRVLRADRQANFEEAAAAIAEMLVKMLTLVKQKRLAADADVEPYKERLAERYYESLRRLEAEARRRVQQTFGHRQLVVDQKMIAQVDTDLFNVSQWNHLGVTGGQLIVAGTATGAAAGGAIDVALGGASLLAGLLVGGAAGGLASWFAAARLPQVKVRGIPLGGQLLEIGPMSNPEFPWVALDRSLLFLDLVTTRPHAVRAKAKLDSRAEDAGPERIVAHLPTADRKRIGEVFARLPRNQSGEAVDRAKQQLAAELWELLHARDTEAATV